MTLHDYLQSEQARSDVRELLDSCDGAENSWADKTVEGGFHWMTEDAGAWWRVGLEDSHAHNVYYRPDGNRYIVTDLGEGVRALRLRTGWIHGRATGYAMQQRETLSSGGLGWVAGMCGDVELDGIKDENLPGAICRVMLASLRVAEVTL